MKRVLITGITGFIGKNLAERYLENGYEVYGNIYDKSEEPPSPRDNLHLEYCDVRNESQVHDLIKKSKPDLIYHLAAQSDPLKSWEDIIYTMETNVFGTIHLFSAIMKEKLDPLVLMAASSGEYGMTTFTSKEPINEEAPLLPVHPYGLSKVCQDLLSWQYFIKNGIRVVRARIFNTIGPSKKNDFVGQVSKQIADIIEGRSEPIVKVGDLTPQRDVTDVRDQVSALMTLIENGKPGEVYNVCSGRNISMRELLDKMIKISNKEITIEEDPAKLRTIDEPAIYGDSSKIRKECQWEQKYDIDTTLKDSIEFWLQN